MLNLAHRPINAFFANLLLLIAAASTTIFFDGYFIKHVGWIGRIAFLVGALMVFFPDMLLTAFGLGIIFIVGIYYFYTYVKSDPAR